MLAKSSQCLECRFYGTKFINIEAILFIQICQTRFQFEQKMSLLKCYKVKNENWNETKKLRIWFWKVIDKVFNNKWSANIVMDISEWENEFDYQSLWIDHINEHG